MASAIASDVGQGWIAALNALNLGQVIPQLTGAWDAFLDGVNKAIAELSTQDLVLVGAMLVLRLPSFSGHPISTDLVSVGEDVHCEFVKEEVHPGVPAGGRQTGYKWTHIQQQRLTGKDDRASFYDDVDRKIHQIWKDSDEVYGAPRITAELGERYQISVNRKTVAKRMRLMGIEGISPRAFVPVTTIQSKRKSALPDLVKRMFDTGELNRVWMSDITYLRTGEGWLYLCAVRDGHSRRVLGWAMDSVQDTYLVERALRMAHTLRSDVPEGLVFRSS
ncbi:IS3 family transposase [Corynebacterium accolens]|uniref:IS3 family transposase n=1 Tax=Corynebacterium accolens TaxID=38284 RepID=UPI003F6824FD